MQYIAESKMKKMKNIKNIKMSVISEKEYNELIQINPMILTFFKGVHTKLDVQEKLLNYREGPVVFYGYNDENRVDEVYHKGMKWYHVTKVNESKL